MYAHHKESIQNLVGYFKEDDHVLAIVLGGSVAKELARIDSDLDAIVVVTEERYEALSKENRLSECIWGHCTYEGGYFDVKYCTKSYLQAVASHGSEPSRNAFLCAKCIYSVDDTISEIIPQIAVFQTAEKADKMLSFYSALQLNAGYFWGASQDNPYLRMRAACDIVLFGFRLLLQENEVLFPCHKALLQTVSSLAKKPENIVALCHTFLSQLDNQSKDDFVNSILQYLSYTPPSDYREVLTRFIDDNELWWNKHRPNIAEW